MHGDANERQKRTEAMVKREREKRRKEEEEEEEEGPMEAEVDRFFDRHTFPPIPMRSNVHVYTRT